MPAKTAKKVENHSKEGPINTTVGKSVITQLMNGSFRSEHSTKITVVVTLWLVTSFLMLHVPSILRNVFSVFNVWQRLVNMFNAHDDDRVPKFQVSHNHPGAAEPGAQGAQLRTQYLP